MGLIQTGHGSIDLRTLENTSPTMDFLYGCDGCEAATGDVYQTTTKVVVDRADASPVGDDPRERGWTFEFKPGGATRAFCPKCSKGEWMPDSAAS